MKTNFFIKNSFLLPVEVKCSKDGIFYQFNTQIEEFDFYSFKEEMPGELIYDTSEYDHENIVTVAYEIGIYSIYKAELLADGIELVKVIETTSVYDFYVSLFEFRSLIHKESLDRLSILAPDVLFNKEIERLGLEEQSRETGMIEGGYDRTDIYYKTRDNKYIRIIYPQYDYQPNKTYYVNNQGTSDGFLFNWVSFFEALSKGNIELYEGYILD